MPPGTIIRAAEAGDVEGLTALANLPGYRFGTLRLPFERVETMRRRVLDGGSNAHMLVADLDGRIVGTIGLLRRIGRQAHVGEIGMGVHDGFLRQGIGAALLSAALDLTDHWLGLTRVELTVNVDNAAAIALYERAGFEIEGRQRRSVLRNGVLIDAFAMARLKEPPKAQNGA